MTGTPPASQAWCMSGRCAPHRLMLIVSYADLSESALCFACFRHESTFGRPLVDRTKGSSLHNLKELRPGSSGSSEVRVLFVFDPWRSAILLVAGDKAGNWSGWYRWAIPRAEGLYEIYVKERAAEEAGA